LIKKLDLANNKSQVYAVLITTITNMADKVLITEDDKFLSKIYFQKLEGAGLEVELAVDGDDAIEKMKSIKPKLVLLDLIMPRKNGFEVLKIAKEDEELKNIPIIIFSNLAQESDIEKGKKLGAVDYIVKGDTPFSVILETINKYLK
jgi:DNA-binding response OmpR family regulator